jgi:hypothetical protein
MLKWTFFILEGIFFRAPRTIWIMQNPATQMNKDLGAGLQLDTLPQL